MSPHEPHDTVTPQRVGQILWRRRWVCLVVALVVLVGGTVYSLAQPTVYESTSSVALLPVSNNSAVLPNYPNLIASLIPTYVQLVSSPVLLERTAAAVPFSTSADQLANDVHGESLSSAAVITIVGQNTNPARAQQIAAAATAAFLELVRGNGVVVAQLYGRPTLPQAPSSPRTKLTLLAILVLAVFLGLAAGLVWDRLARRSEDTFPPASAVARPPVLGVVHDFGLGNGMSAAGGDPKLTLSHNGWRSLRTNFMYSLLGQEVRSVTVMSPLPGTAKTTVAANLAATLAEMGLAVVLVDADVRHPSLHEVFSMERWQGLSSTILDGADPATLPRPVPTVAGLQVVTAGPPLRARRDEITLYREQLPKLTNLADLVIVDGPSLRPDSDADLVAGVTDGVVLVVESKTITWEQLRTTVDGLTSLGTRVLGTVLAGVGRPTDFGQS
ncbi:MAG TPA: P-loop NTPase [Streptosporangiaceae bacterium]|nr:P-loop NTPase [Streptosporangiaceae bacterium]